MSKPSTKKWAEYARDVATGKAKAGQYVQKLVERFIELLNDPGEWEFKAATGEKYIQFIQDYLVHTRGEWAGKPFILSPWQQFFIVNIFGWFHKTKGYRKHRTALLFVARKSGKTPPTL